MTTRVRARWLIAWDGTDHRTIDNGEMIFDTSGVVFVGHGWSGHVDRTIDYGNAVLGPGFIDLDALGDIDSTILGFDNQPGWQKGRIWPRDYLASGPRDALDDDALDLAKRWAYTSLLRNGITTVVPITSIIYRAWSETYDEFARAVDIAAETGIRAFLGPAYCSGRSIVDDNGYHDMMFDESRGLAGLDDAVRFIDRFDGAHGGLVRGFLAPDRIEGCTGLLLERTRDAALALDVPVRLHCCQSALEIQEMQRRHGAGSLEVLERTGLLERAPLLPHGVLLGGWDPDDAAVAADIERLVASGATLVHCPLVMARHGQMLSSFAALSARGVRIGLGTDTFPADMVLNMQLGVVLSRISAGNMDATSAAALYRCATVGGADALGRRDLGRLCAGAAADFSVFDLDCPGTGPLVDPIQTLVLAGAGLGFRHVFVSGRQVIRDGEPTNHDRHALHAGINRIYRRFRSTYSSRTPGHPSESSIFPPAFAGWAGESTS